MFFEALVNAAPVDLPSDRSQINDYFATLPDWDKFANVQSSDTIKGDVKSQEASMGSVQLECSVQDITLTDTPKELVTFGTGSDAFWLGALLQGKGYVDGVGGFKPLPIGDRNEQKITVDFLNGKSSSSICKPDSGAVRDAIAGLVSHAKSGGYRPGANIHYKTVEVNSAESAALNLGFGAKYLAFQAKTALDTQRNYTENTIAAYFVEKAFTVDVAMPKTPADFFNSQFTMQDLKEQIRFGRLGPDNLPIFVSSISYGRVLLYSVTSSASSSDIRATIQASYNGLKLGVDSNLDIKHQKLLSESKISVAVIGGNREAAINLIRDGNLNSFFSQESTLETYVPISYTLRSIANGNLAAVSETTKYTIKACHPVRRGYKWTFKIVSLKLIDPAEPASDDTAEAWGDIVLNGQYIWSVEKPRYQSIRAGQDVNFIKSPKATVFTDLADDVSPPFSLYLNFIDDDTWNGGFDSTIVNGNFTEWEVGTHTMKLRSEGEMLLTYTITKEKFGTPEK
ncbi:Perfringolysin [Basidiobolus meristosporus CBS 931.73]|uniref:Perfringolysin n=1 Tax=Basidiobolus meristosporus CBS 931.73 TaxID=1314790 RepID=A0A1Y1YIH2_9FUNG|nr:Perfringolysin [Basidiobolus meristosporus CBS 931.73]|eukprot:ORX97792.1 Perfringolysin [Basidiobolus meristosporus CBS 931.73]